MARVFDVPAGLGGTTELATGTTLGSATGLGVAGEFAVTTGPVEAGLGLALVEVGPCSCAPGPARAATSGRLGGTAVLFIAAATRAGRVSSLLLGAGEVPDDRWIEK